MCNFCNIENKSELLNIFTDIEKDNFVLGVKNETITIENMDVDIYTKTGLKLQRAVELGYELTVNGAVQGSYEYNLLSDFTTNVFAFSAAKQYQLIRELNDIKLDNEIEWKNEAILLFNKYYSDYFSAEYDAAIQQGKSAKEWSEIEKWASQ